MASRKRITCKNCHRETRAIFDPYTGRTRCEYCSKDARAPRKPTKIALPPRIIARSPY